MTPGVGFKHRVIDGQDQRSRPHESVAENKRRIDRSRTVRLDWHYESDNDGFTLIPRLQSDPTQPFAAIVIDDPDRNFGSLSGGVSWVRPGGTQFYVSIFRTIAYDDLEQWVLRGGLRWEF